MSRLFVLAAAVLWGTTGTTQALALASLHPVAVSAVRIGLGAAGLLIAAAAAGALRHGVTRRPIATLVAGAAVAANQPLFFGSVRTTGVAVGTAVTIGSAPIFAGLLDRIVNRRTPGRRWAIATAVAVSGAVLLLGPPASGVQPGGVLLGMAAGGAYAVYAVAAKRRVEGEDPLMAMAVVFAVAALLVLPMLAAFDIRPVSRPYGRPAALYLGLVTVSLAYWLFGRGLTDLPASTAATLTLAEPLTAGLLGVFLIGERLAPSSAAGLALVGFGLLVMALPEGLSTILPKRFQRE